MPPIAPGTTGLSQPEHGPHILLIAHDYARLVRLVVLLLVTALGAATQAAPAAASPAVPAFVQGLVKKRAGNLAFVPTRVLLGYRYESYRISGQAPTVVLRFRRSKPAQNQPPWFTVTVRPYAGKPADCGNGMLQTQQLGGNKVYWDGTSAWRCQPFAGGAARISVSGPPTDPTRFAAAFAYGRVTASVKRISQRLAERASSRRQRPPSGSSGRRVNCEGRSRGSAWADPAPARE
jgi:hypothetical protein